MPEEFVPIKVEMTVRKETPGTRVYAADDPASPVASQYIKKSAKTPDRIVVIIEAAD